MPEYIRVRHEVTGHEYDKTADSPLRENEKRIDRPRIAGRWMPPKHRVTLAGRPATARPKTPAATADGHKAAEPADTEKE